MSTKDPTYDVGYGKPPKHSQFKKTVSGNPKGRPVKRWEHRDEAVSLYEDVRIAANRKVTVREGGRVKKIRAGNAVVTRAMNLALTGDDPRAIDRVLKLVEKADRAAWQGRSGEPMQITIIGGLPD